jgi:hypothetical protein
MGRRQLFVKFADEAETATIYTAEALRGELARLTTRSKYHSVTIAGRDALAEEEFLRAAFRNDVPLPVMLDHDGQRPEALQRLLPSLAMVQISLAGTEGKMTLERVAESLTVAANKHVAHAIAITPDDAASDAPLLRIVEQVHRASAEAQILVHPTLERWSEKDRRWMVWLEQAMAVHPDVRVLPGWPARGRR